MQIEFEIDQQRLTRTSDAYLIEGSKNFVECVFSFSSDWNELDKWALFKRDNNTYEIFIEDNKCLAPIQCTSTEGEFTISVVGRKNAKNVTGTASDKLLTVRDSEFVSGMSGEERLTETYLVEVLGEVRELQLKTATSEANAAQSAKESADSAAEAEASAQRAERAADATKTVNEQLDKVERLAAQVQTNTNTTNSAAESARDDAEKAKAWAEGTLPGGIGTKSSKEWATDARASAGSAATSERNAASSENTATGKANAATLKAQEAASSAAAAQKSAENAGVKANEAGASAGNALTSAKNAAASETNAAASAKNAAASEGNVATNATKATEQAKLATDKATDAANSAASSKANADAAIEAKNAATLKAKEAADSATKAQDYADFAAITLVAGVKFTPTAETGTRLAAAENLTWEKSTELIAGRDDFPAKFNCFNTYEALVKGGKVVATEGSYEFEKYKDDDEYDADVFVMFPKGYGRRYYDGDGNEYRLASDRRLAGYVPSPLHMVEGTEYDVVGITKYGWCDNGSGGICSRAGKPKRVNISWQDFETKSVARGTEIHAMSFSDVAWLQHLGCIKYGNRNWQNAVGNGVMNGYTEVAIKKCTVTQESAASIIIDNTTAANFAVGDSIYLSGVTMNGGIYTRMILSIADYDENNKTINVDGPAFKSRAGTSGFYRGCNWSGETDSVLGLDGEISGGTSGRKSVKTLGLENFFANDWKLLGDAFRVGNDVYINTKPLSASAWPSSANDAIAKGWIRLGDVLPSTNGYIKTLAYSMNYPLISLPATIGGDSQRPVGDYFYTSNDTTGLKILRLGGDLSGGAACGSFFVAVLDGLGVARFRYGAFGVFRPQ